MAVKWSRNAVAGLKDTTHRLKRGTNYRRQTVRPTQGPAQIPFPEMSLLQSVIVANLDEDIEPGDTGPATIDPSGDEITVINKTERKLLETTRGYIFAVGTDENPEFFPNTLADCPVVESEPVNPDPEQNPDPPQ